MSRLRQQPTGFTMIEMLIVITIVIMGAAIGFPAFSKWVKKSKVETTASAARNLCALGRQTAIRNGRPVILRADLTSQEFVLFANVDGDAGNSYSPDATATAKTVDYEITRVALPQDAQVSFGGPGGNGNGGGGNGNGGGGNGNGGGGNGNGGGGNGGAPTSWISSAATIGLTPSSDGGNVAIFGPDGSIRDAGAINFSDTRLNHMQLRIDPRATAKCTVLKYNAAPAWGGTADFFPRGVHSSGASLWTWHS